MSQFERWALKHPTLGYFTREGGWSTNRNQARLYTQAGHALTSKKGIVVEYAYHRRRTEMSDAVRVKFVLGIVEEIDE